MAHPATQTEPGGLKPLILKDAEKRLENIESKIGELSSLIYMVARAEDLDPEVSSALRGIGKVAAQIGCELAEVGEALCSASGLECDEKITEFPERG